MGASLRSECSCRRTHNCMSGMDLHFRLKCIATSSCSLWSFSHSAPWEAASSKCWFLPFILLPCRFSSSRTCTHLITALEHRFRDVVSRNSVQCPFSSCLSLFLICDLRCLPSAIIPGWMPRMSSGLTWICQRSINSLRSLRCVLTASSFVALRLMCFSRSFAFASTTCCVSVPCMAIR